VKQIALRCQALLKATITTSASPPFGGYGGHVFISYWKSKKGCCRAKE